MANIKWAMTVDANQKELQNVQVHNVNGNPTTPVAGQVWYDTATGKFMYRDGVAGSNIDLRARANHTGTQLAATVSDFTAAVQAIRWASMVSPNASVDFNSQKAINQADPTNPQDSATKNYVDVTIASATAGITYKAPVRVATTANITLSGTQTIDSVSVTAGQRVLVKNQSTAANNGIYLCAAGAWTRTTDADSAAELEGGVIVPVDEGTANANTMWMLASDITTLGTDAMSWVQFGTGTVYTASLGVQLVGSDIRANLGAGLTLSGNTIVPDYTGSNVLKRKIATGVVGTSGADITITHSFALANKEDVIVQVWESGVLTQVGVTAVDVNSLTLSFAVTPTSNQYRYSMIGLT